MWILGEVLESCLKPSLNHLNWQHVVCGVITVCLLCLSIYCSCFKVTSLQYDFTKVRWMCFCAGTLAGLAG